MAYMRSKSGTGYIQVNGPTPNDSGYLKVGSYNVSPIDMSRLVSKEALIQEIEKCHVSNNLLRREVNDLNERLRTTEKDKAKAEESGLKMRERIVKLQGSIKTLENNQLKLKAKLADKESIKKLKEESRKTEKAEKELRDLKQILEEKDQIIAEQEHESNEVKKRLKEVEKWEARDAQRERREIEREKEMKAEMNAMKNEIIHEMKNEMTGVINDMRSMMMEHMFNEKQTTEEKMENQHSEVNAGKELQVTREHSFDSMVRSENSSLNFCEGLTLPQLSKTTSSRTTLQRPPWQYTSKIDKN